MTNSSNQVQLKVYITQSLNQKLRKLIAEKYQKYEKGLLSYEITSALQYWLALHTQAQSQPMRNQQLPNPAPKFQIVFWSIKDYLRVTFGYELRTGMQVPTVHLREAIEAVRGSDRRTVAKWFRLLEQMDCVKPITSATYEIM